MLYLRNSLGTPAGSGFIPEGFPSFDSGAVKGYHYDPGKALQLLKEAGFPNGRGLKPVKLLTVPVYTDVASYIANELMLIGIPIEVETVQKSLLLEQTAKSEALFFRGSWIADYPDAKNLLSVFYRENPAPPKYTRLQIPNSAGWHEPALPDRNDPRHRRSFIHTADFSGSEKQRPAVLFRV